MTDVDIPLVVAVPVALLVLAGAFLTMAGSIGLVRLRDFYRRIHAPTIGTSFGTIFIALGSVLYFSFTRQRPAVHEVLLIVFVSVTTPVTLMLLARAALYRDRTEGQPGVPPPPAEEG